MQSTPEDAYEEAVEERDRLEKKVEALQTKLWWDDREQRDRFAAAALTGILGHRYNEIAEENTVQNVRDAYRYAESMMKKRKELDGCKEGES